MKLKLKPLKIKRDKGTNWIRTVVNPNVKNGHTIIFVQKGDYTGFSAHKKGSSKFIKSLRSRKDTTAVMKALKHGAKRIEFWD